MTNYPDLSGNAAHPATINDKVAQAIDLAGGLYEATPPTLVDGQSNPLRVDSAGALVISGAMTDSGSVAVTGPMTSAQFLANMRSTGTFSSVNSAATSTTILAANANRKGAIIVNTDANILYLDLSGGTAATTQYAKALATGEQYEVPFGCTNLITGIWAADGAGAALVTEFA